MTERQESENLQPSLADIETELLRLARIRAHSFCPSEAARALAEDWRPLMPLIRDVAADLQARGELDILQKGERVTRNAKGPIRLRRAAR